MIEFGHYALCLTFILAVFQMVVGLFQSSHNSPSGLPRMAALLQVLCLSISWFCLTIAYINSDFSAAVIVGNSHTTKPLIYKITGVWGNHEGSMLLWLMVLTLFGGAFAWKGRKQFAISVYQKALGLQGLIASLFAGFILFTSNPFSRVFPVPLDGQGLNPLLQDIGLAMHPPMLYLGYVGFSMVFSLTAAALLTRNIDPVWARNVRPWALAAWVLLTAGIGLGCWWAYYELGWGGFWFWDPVENASLMPWLAGTALIHSLRLLEKRNTLKHWVVLMSLLAFSCSLLGTFLVRSGIVTSVHAFAASPDRGLFILAILALLVGGGLTLYTMRSKDLESETPLNFFSKEGMLVLGNLFLTVSLFTVLTGTLAPVLTEALSQNKISVGPPYYNQIFLPLCIVMAITMSFGMRLGWGKGRLSQVSIALGAVVILTAIGVSSLVLLYRLPWVGYAGFALGLWVVFAVLIDFIEVLVKRRTALSLSYTAMICSHLGIGIALLGVTGTTIMVKETLVSVKKGDVFWVDDYEMKYLDVRITSNPDYLSETAKILVRQDKKNLPSLYPERRLYKVSGQTTTEADIRLYLGGDLYVALGETQPDGKRAIRAWHHPLVSLLWFGMILTVFGGLCAFIQSVRSKKASGN